MQRTVKQVLYGAFYAFFWLIVIYGGYRLTLAPPPTCTDGVQNRDEVEVDCGGAYCQSCAIKHLAPIRFAAVQLLPSAQGNGTTALVEIQNPNQAYGTPRLQYTVYFYDGSGREVGRETDTTQVYPAEIKSRLIVNAAVSFASIQSAAAVAAEGYEWQGVTEFARPKALLRDVRIERRADAGRVIVTGLVKNENPFGVRRVTLNAVVSDQEKRLIAASKTVVQDLTATEERFFQIDILLPEGVAAETLGEPRITTDVER